MHLSDPIYGDFSIEEPLVVELLNAPTVLRLQKLSQYGIPDKYYHLKNFSRYEHSVGVMLLLRRFGASIPEQVAGLLHDVSHLAFSHVADWVFGEGKRGVESFQDNRHEAFLESTEIPGILARHGLTLETIIHHEHFTLLEKESPDLCADRVDYALREFYHWLAPDIVQSVLNGLVAHEGEMVCRDQETASLFASNFLTLQMQHWGGEEAIRRYALFADMLLLLLEKGVLTREDFSLTDDEVMQKIEGCPMPEARQILGLLAKKSLSVIVQKGERVFKKFRYIDPHILVDGNLVRLSAVDSFFAIQLAAAKKMNDTGVMV